MARDRRTRSSRLLMPDPDDANVTRGNQPHAGHTEAYSRLTEREQEILRLVAQGKSNKEIARALVISASTAKHHVSNLLHKLGVESRVGAAVLWTKWSQDEITNYELQITNYEPPAANP